MPFKQSSTAIVPKLWYFCHFAALSCLFPYFNLYFRRLGFNESQIGLLTAFRPWVSFPAGSLWSGAADKLRAHRVVLLVLFCVSTVSRLSMAAAGSFVSIFLLVIVTEFFSAAITIIADAAVTAACTKEGDYGRQRLFGAIGWGTFSAVVGIAISYRGVYATFVCHAMLSALEALPTVLLQFGPLQAKLDATAEMLSKPQSDVEAKQRNILKQQTHQQPQPSNACELELPKRDSGLAGISGFVAAPKIVHGQNEDESSGLMEREPLLREDEVTLGAAQERDQHIQAKAKHGQESSESGSQHAIVLSSKFVQQGSAGELTSCTTEPDLLSNNFTAQKQCTSSGTKVQFWQGIGQLMQNPHALLFFGMVTIMGFGVGNIEGYLFLYLDELGGSEALMGISLTVTCVAEILVFFFSGSIIQRLGAKRCLNVVFFAFLVRLLCYATLAWWGSPWKVLPVELLHGFTFALAWGTGTAYSSWIAPPGLESTTQALFQGLYFGVGYGIGGLVGGAVYQNLGAQEVYWVAFLVMTTGWVAGWLLDLYISLFVCTT